MTKINKPNKAKKLTITNSKGGVGKTSTIVFLARLFALMKKKVLLVSLDRQCNLDSSFGFIDSEYKESDKSALQLFSNKKTKECIRKTEIDNIDIILSNYRMNKLVKELYKLKFNQGVKIEHILKNKLDEVIYDYDWIIIDSGPNFDLLTENSLAAADKVIIPINPDFYSREVLELLITDILDVKNYLNDSLEIAGIFINKYQKKRAHERIYREMKEILGDIVLDTKIYDRTLIAKNIENEKDSFNSQSKEALEIINQYMSLIKECL